MRNYQQASKVLSYLTQLAERDLPDKPEFTEVRRQLLEEALKYYREFIEDASDDDASIVDELNEAKTRVVGLLESLGKKEDAVATAEMFRLEPPRNSALGSPGSLLKQRGGPSPLL